MILALLLAAQAQTVAVLEFQSKLPEAKRLDAGYLADRVRAAVKDELPGARVITRENMLVLMKASGKDLASCEGACEVETGRLIGADLVVSGELLEFGAQTKLNLKLHDTRSGELLSGAVASGESAGELDRDIGPAAARLLAPLLRAEARPPEAKDTVREAPRLSAQLWVTLGYDWATNSPAAVVQTASGMGWDLGGHVMVRVGGPIYVGGLADYGFTGPNALLVAPGLRFWARAVAVTGAFGYSNFQAGGPGALAAVDVRLEDSISLRVQGSWRHSSTQVATPLLPSGPADDTRNVWSLMGGLSLHL